MLMRDSGRRKGKDPQKRGKKKMELQVKICEGNKKGIESILLILPNYILSNLGE